MEGSLPQ
ncbi:hypothetical protein CGLO_14036 [Colletotrichum gloeosporioides Cg-14]|nr:hypothetical protein CGLO_14036 [Colletotrichum gloeosporioides Cg-14]